MKCVKVPLKQLNDTRIELMEKGLMNMEYRIKAEDEFGYIPVNTNVEGYEIVCIDWNISEFILCLNPIFHIH